MHKMHFFVTGLKEGRLVLRNFQDNFGSSSNPFNSFNLGGAEVDLNPYSCLLFVLISGLSLKKHLQFIFLLNFSIS